MFATHSYTIHKEKYVCMYVCLVRDRKQMWENVNNGCLQLKNIWVFIVLVL